MSIGSKAIMVEAVNMTLFIQHCCNDTSNMYCTSYACVSLIMGPQAVGEHRGRILRINVLAGFMPYVP